MADAGVALDWMRARLGTGESPPGSNCVPGISDVCGLGCVPWCAETVSLAIDHAFGDDRRWQVPGVAPTYSWGIAYVPSMRAAFAASGLYEVDLASQGRPATANPGDLVCFDWPGAPLAHVGMVEQALGDGTLITLEGNHNDALVRMRRSRAVVNGICHVPYAGTPAPGPTPAPPPPPPGPRPAGNPHLPLAVDGGFGPLTTKAMQWVLGVDDDGVFGPVTRRALQAHLGVGVDGAIGRVTVRALQSHVGAAVDGDWGPDTTRHLQDALNRGSF